MKHFLLPLVAFAITVNTSGQSCLTPNCDREVQLGQTGAIPDVTTFNNYNGIKTTTCFTQSNSGSVLVITENMNLNGIKNYVFKPAIVRYDVRQTINLQGSDKIYVSMGANVTLKNLSLNGGDTIFVTGSLEILSVQSVNNSIPGKRAVIIIQAGGFLLFNGVQYMPGRIFQGPGNNVGNQIDIVAGCNNILPVKFQSVNIKKITPSQLEVRFLIGEASNVKEFYIQIQRENGVFVNYKAIKPKAPNPEGLYIDTLNLRNY